MIGYNAHIFYRALKNGLWFKELAKKAERSDYDGVLGMKETDSTSYDVTVSERSYFS